MKRGVILLLAIMQFWIVAISTAAISTLGISGRYRLASAEPAVLQDSIPPTDVSCQGFLYRSKKADVAVYREPSLSSEVVARLGQGQTVCYVGERAVAGSATFAVVALNDSRIAVTSGVSSSGISADANTLPNVAYVRLVDLWPPKRGPKPTRADESGFFQDAKRLYRSFELGVTPELAPFPTPALPGSSDQPSDRPSVENGASSQGVEADTGACAIGLAEPPCKK